MKKILITLLLIIAAIYYKSLNNPLVFDDIGLDYLSNVIKTHFPNLGWVSRVIAEWTFQQTYLFTTDIRWHRAFNVIAHMGSVVLLYAVIKNFYNEKVALISAILFGLNPAAMFAVVYLIERTILLATMFGLLQIYLLQKAYSHRSSDSIIFYLGAAIACICALNCKEHAAPLAILFPAMAILYSRRRYTIVGIIVTVIMAYFAMMNNRHFISEGSYYQLIVTKLCNYQVDWLHSAVTQAFLFFKYLWLWVNPLAVRSIDMREVFSQSIHSYIIWVYAYFGLFLTGVILLFRKKVIGLAIVLTCSLFLVELQTVRIGEMFVLYRSYIYAIGYSIFFAPLLNVIKFDKSLALIASLAILFFGYNTFKDLDQFETPIATWQQAVNTISAECQGSRVYGNLGAELIGVGQNEEAYQVLQNSIKYGMDYEGSVANLAAACKLTGRKDEAIKYYQIAAKAKNQQVRETAIANLKLLGVE